MSRLSGCGPALMLVLALTAPASAASFDQYANARFGYVIDTPADWQRGAEADNGDGLRLTSPDGKGSIAAWGSMQTEDKPEDGFRRLSAPHDGEKITYRKRTGNALTVSGTGKGTVFYRRHILSCGGTVWNNVEITYPLASKSAYEPLVTRVARSLKPGKGGQTQNCP